MTTENARCEAERLLADAYDRGVWEALVEEHGRAKALELWDQWGDESERYAVRAARAILNRADPKILGRFEAGKWRKPKTLGRK